MKKNPDCFCYNPEYFCGRTHVYGLDDLQMSPRRKEDP